MSEAPPRSAAAVLFSLQREGFSARIEGNETGLWDRFRERLEADEADEEAYETWADAHEELEDLIDEVRDRLEEE